MELKDFEFARNVIADFDITQYAALNESLDACSSNARFGPPVYTGIAKDPVVTREIGIYIHKDSHPERGKSRTVLRLDSALEQLADMYSQKGEE